MAVKTKRERIMNNEYGTRARLIREDLGLLENGKNNSAINSINYILHGTGTQVGYRSARLFPRDSFEGCSDRDLFIFSAFSYYGRLIMRRSKDSDMKDFIDSLYYESGSHQNFMDILKNILSSGYVVNIDDNDISSFVKECLSNHGDVPFGFMLDIISPTFKRSKIYPLEPGVRDDVFIDNFDTACNLLSDVKY